MYLLASFPSRIRFNIFEELIYRTGGTKLTAVGQPIIPLVSERLFLPESIDLREKLLANAIRALQGVYICCLSVANCSFVSI